MNSKTKNLQYLKSSNQAAIYKHLATNGPTSRAELSREFGLSRMAITNLVSDMIQEGLLLEGEPAALSKNSARKSIALQIPDYCITAVGVLIERYSVHCNAMDIKGNEFYRDCAPIPDDATNELLLNIILGLLNKLFEELPGYNFSGIGISSIGPVDIETCTILHPTNFYKVSNFPLGNILMSEFKLPVYILNCMSAATLAEHLFGNARGHRNMVYLGFGSGVGSGTIINNKIFTGSKGFAGELGHTSIDPINGPVCSCGQHGCIETYTSTRVVLRELGCSSFDEVLEAYDRNEFSLQQWAFFENYYHAVLTALLTAANIYDPEIIVVGDQGSALIERFITKLTRQLNCLMIQHGTRMMDLKVSAFGDKAALIGAPCIVFDQIFARNLPPFDYS